MKKVLALILCFLTLIPSVSVFAAEENSAPTVFGPKNPFVNQLLTGTGASLELFEDSDKTYIRGTAVAGAYGNGALQFMLKQDEIPL